LRTGAARDFNIEEPPLFEREELFQESSFSPNKVMSVVAW
jgi:hypothetical protein